EREPPLLGELLGEGSIDAALRLRQLLVRGAIGGRPALLQKGADLLAQRVGRGAEIEIGKTGLLVAQRAREGGVRKLLARGMRAAEAHEIGMNAPEVTRRLMLLPEADAADGVVIFPRDRAQPFARKGERHRRRRRPSLVRAVAFVGRARDEDAARIERDQR